MSELSKKKALEDPVIFDLLLSVAIGAVIGIATFI